ncbi:iron ABC transporter permease [Photobacterium gaetbulicola]|uniref:Putative hemin ABC transporter, permease protein n=1 Tax=Photobacterium gaetbulicola Gung47 TaxID=658445 RepID=A0A0C5WV62_9GAMM|nr:iron ABC transporter permease [Photobacterium gaetbulicola]AJR08964.1 putative hemin ABC transporter, permease protein [Photobacterium gaetbulicola Gung47]PSU13520.1 iron ABC transporter permease [Photobacterium gaetbulicola]
MQLQRIPTSLIFPVGLTLLVIAVTSSIAVGPMDISFADSFKALLPFNFDLPPHIDIVIHQIRLPRTLLGMAIGAILALCGAVMQGLFRNPLADPGIIGVSGGASLGAALSIVIFAPLAASFPLLLTLGTVPVFAFFGGAISTFLVYQLGTDKNGTSVTIMLLAGVAIGALSGAALGLMNYYADDQALRDLSLWTMGSLAGATWPGIGLAYITLLGLLFAFDRNANALNAFLLGEAEAKHLGVNVQRLKRVLILLCAAGVGIAVSLTGVIGFVGLIVPHISRMLSGPNHKSLLPLSALLGALILLIADMLARVVAAPAELPVGIITALLGAPFFIYLLIKQKGKLS